ncbi:hypothetical protein [Flavobacterium sp.]|uniref:hypothetical protein n=1 Tax=Flavobacterium sp. TaxID=239 RepID=UPI0037C18D2F
MKLEQKTSESDTTSMLEHISRWSSVIESIISAMSHQHYSIMFVDGGLHGHMTNWLINEKTPKQLEYLASIYKNILNLYQDRYDFRHISLLETFNPDLPEPENLVFWDHALEMLYHFRQPGFDNLPIEHIGLTSNSGHAIVGDYTAENFQLKGNEDEHASLFH